MRKDLFAEMYKLEEDYWWHVAKRRLVKKMLEQYVSGYKNKVYVDVGCGTGKMMEEMNRWKKWKKVVGLDGAEEALEFCRKRKIARVKKADFEKRLPLEDESVDVITSLDVVEHISGDRKLLAEFYRVLKPGGLVVITVPAYRWLWTYWDDMLGHKRRYRRGELKKKLEKVGFQTVKLSYFYSFLLPVAVFFRILKTIIPRMKQASDFIALPKKVNQGLIHLAEIEMKVLDQVRIPVGLSVVGVAKKS